MKKACRILIIVIYWLISGIRTDIMSDRSCDSCTNESNDFNSDRNIHVTRGRQSKSGATSVSTRIIITTNQRIIVINYVETGRQVRDTYVGLANWQSGTPNYRGINNDSHWSVCEFLPNVLHIHLLAFWIRKLLEIIFLVSKNSSFQIWKISEQFQPILNQ